MSTKWTRRDTNNYLNNINRNALEKGGLGASFEGYYTFFEALDVALSEVKRACTTLKFFKKNLDIHCIAQKMRQDILFSNAARFISFKLLLMALRVHLWTVALKKNRKI